MKRNLLVVMFICILLVISCAKEQQSPVKENKGTKIEMKGWFNQPFFMT